MITTKFIFPNFGGKTHPLQLERSSRVNELKEGVVKKIMQENNYNKEGQEPKIRLFHLGSELQEGKTLNDYAKTTDAEGNPEIILHVFISHQKAQPVSSSAGHVKKDKRSEGICNCNIF